MGLLATCPRCDVNYSTILGLQWMSIIIIPLHFNTMSNIIFVVIIEQISLFIMYIVFIIIVNTA